MNYAPARTSVRSCRTRCASPNISTRSLLSVVALLLLTNTTTTTTYGIFAAVFAVFAPGRRRSRYCVLGTVSVLDDRSRHILHALTVVVVVVVVVVVIDFSLTEGFSIFLLDNNSTTTVRRRIFRRFLFLFLLLAPNLFHR